MKGDFSRRVFDPGRHYAGVLHQQGRVWLDSDWNEDVSERLALLRDETTDIVGMCGVPEPGAAFLISANPIVTASAPGDFLIGGGPGNLGRAYVDGVLCQIDTPTTYLTQPDLPVPPTITMPADGSDLNAVVYLEVWRRLITALEDTTLREVALGGPDTTARVKTVAQVRVAVVPQTSPATQITSDTARQFLPLRSGGTLTTLQPQIAASLDQCQLPDPNNFTGRENRLYRVEIHTGGDPVGSGASSLLVSLGQDAAAGATTLVLAQALTAQQIDLVTRWGAVTLTDNNGQSAAATVAGVANNGQSLVLAQGLAIAFTTAANAQVFGTARFKWSRDNASFAVGVTAVSADRQTLTVATLGRDQATALRQGDLVEVCDDASELGAARGHLTNLKSDPDPDRLTVVIADALPLTFQVPGGSTSPPTSPPVAADRHLVLRRWDGQGTAQTVFSPTGSPDMDLGDGVQIQFGGTNLLPGDYWQFATRTTDGSVEALVNASPAGVARHRCPLAVVSWSQQPPGSPPGGPGPSYVLSRIQDCRKVFPPLTEQPRTQAGLHIQQVFTVNQTTGQPAALVNDSTVLVSVIVSGINVQCDGSVDPASVSRPTCFLSIEVPGPTVAAGAGSPPTSLLAGYGQVIVAGNVSATGNTITWLPSGGAANWLPGIALQRPPADRGILARFTLKGNFIWTPTNPPAYLDGEVFGFAQNGVTSLALPSGDRRRGGDFEMWFWLIAQPATLASLAINPPSIFQGDTATATITLSAPATAGLVVTLGSSAPAVAGVPANVTFVTGATTANFPVTGGQVAQSPATVTATLGGISRTATVTVGQRQITLVAVQISPSIVTRGASTTGTVTLSGPAPAGGYIIFASSNLSVATVQAIATPAVGSTTVNFQVTTAAVGTATITATFGNSVTATVTAVKAKEKDKDKDKEKDKETREKFTAEKAVFSETTKIRDRVVAPVRILPQSQLPAASGPANEAGQAAVGRAFIRSDERPAIRVPG